MGHDVDVVQRYVEQKGRSEFEREEGRGRTVGSPQANLSFICQGVLVWNSELGFQLVSLGWNGNGEVGAFILLWIFCLIQRHVYLTEKVKSTCKVRHSDDHS